MGCSLIIIAIMESVLLINVGKSLSLQKIFFVDFICSPNIICLSYFHLLLTTFELYYRYFKNFHLWDDTYI